ncbi:hypothetical protein VaNZ11_002218 [Volvox africanus]|uniref:8-oxo-dGTP diphosphatase n=1 Tax=Volvox africanus TaxID=51714 RepID=A0ABQ5RS79_9CHLO|nr:hypothetical protein VaNZ11_002218 [Volvox africanus]
MLSLTLAPSVGGFQVVRRFPFPSASLKAPYNLWISGFCSFVPSTPPHFRPPNVVVAAAPAGESRGGSTLGPSGNGGLAPGHAVSGGGSRSTATSIPSAGAAATGSSSGNCGSSSTSSKPGSGAGTGCSTRGQAAVRVTALRTVDPVVAAASATRTLSVTPRPATAASAAAVTAATAVSVVRDRGTYSSVDSMDGGGSGGVRLLVVVGVVLLDDPEWTQATAGAAANKRVAAPSAAGAEAVAVAAAASSAELGPISDSVSSCYSDGGYVPKPVRVLLAQRPEGKSNAGLWEFPGGKVDPRETPEEALIRELREELGITVEPADLIPLTFASHTYSTFHLLMPLYVCRRWLGEPVGAEGQAVAWATPEEVSSYNLTPADVPLVPVVLAAMRYGTPVRP